MAKTTTTNASVKAIITHLNNERLNGNVKALIQYKMVSSNMRVGVVNHTEFKKFYSRSHGDGSGATKVTHTHYHDENGKGFEFTDIVVKRLKSNLCSWLGNQGIKEIRMWEKLAETPDSDYLCPILKYFTSKSDKVTEMSETMLNNVVIVAQKATDIGDIEDACKAAERLNRKYGYRGETAKEREKAILTMVRKNNIHDVIGHGGNSGVVFDYHRNCYKAVLIDYGL